MRRIFALFIIALVLISLTGCGDDNTGTVFGAASKITVSPSSSSLAAGTVVNIGALVEDAGGNDLYNSTSLLTNSNVTFKSSNPDVLTISNNGQVCAGIWDSLTTPVVCKPGTKDTGSGAGVGKSDVTVTYGSLTSSVTTFSVHAKIDTIQITPEIVDCESQGATRQLTAKAFSRGQDVTSTVGTFTWSTVSTDVATVDANGVVTAVGPGATTVYAALDTSVKSSPTTFKTCNVASISLHKKDAADTAFAIDNAATQVITADALDTKGNRVITSKLTFTQLAPVVATSSYNAPASGTTATSNEATVTGKAPGVTPVVASCSPPTCNINGNPMYSNVVLATVNGSANATTVWAASTTGTSMVPINTSDNTAGTAVTLPATPNSMIATDRFIYLGSSSGLIVFQIASSTSVTASGAPGTVIATSPDGNRAVTTDGTKVYIYDVTTGAVQSLNVPGVTAGAFAIDATRLFLIGNGNLTTATITSSTPTSGITTYTYTPRTIALAGSDIKLLTTGSLAYVAAGSAIQVVAACNGAPVASLTASGNAQKVASMPGGSVIVVADPPNIDAIAVSNATAGCPPAPDNALTSANVGAYTARQVLTTPNNTRAFVLSDQPGIFAYDVASSTASTIALAGGATAFGGGILPDTKQMYVGGSDGKVHRIDLTTNTDAQQITVSFTPDLVAVRPQ